MYGIQTASSCPAAAGPFENDVKMYGIQTRDKRSDTPQGFENDVKMYGIQTVFFVNMLINSLRMM